MALQSALHIYQSKITQFGEELGPRAYGMLKKGDVAIWHPQLIHGGSRANKPELKRHSMVVHSCPVDTYVFVQDAFFHINQKRPHVRIIPSARTPAGSMVTSPCLALWVQSR